MEFIMTCGLSGSGKSTWAHNQKDYLVLNSDDIRAEIYGDANCQDNPAKIFNTMFYRAYNALNNGISVIYDATNINLKKRLHTLTELKNKLKYKNKDIKYICAVFNTPINICKTNNFSRERQVPEFIIDRQLRNFQFPIENEGWDEIRIITPIKYDKINFNNRIWEQVKDFGSQENPHHSLTLLEHLKQTVNKIDLNRVPSLAIIPLLHAASCHDIGKIYTRIYDENSIAHYYGHEFVSAYLAMNMGLSILTIQLICYHMVLYDNNAMKKWEEKLGKELWMLLKILHNADEKAH